MPNDLLALIKQKQEAIAKLQTELEEARRLLNRALARPPLAGVDIAVHTRAGGPKVKATKGKKLPSHSAKAASRATAAIVPTSSIGLTVSVLREAATPLYIDEIIKRIAENGHKVKKTTLVGNLSRYIKDKKVFYRAAPNTYGLVEQKAS